MDYIAIEKLFELQSGDAASSAAGQPDGQQARRALAEADVIIAIDVASEREFTLYGTPAVEETLTTAALRTVCVAIDQKSGELDKLAALVQILKGVRPAERG